MKLKRYLLFAYQIYYPIGGWGDLIGSANTIEEAEALLGGVSYYDEFHIIDLETGETVYDDEEESTEAPVEIDNIDDAYRVIKQKQTASAAL